MDFYILNLTKRERERERELVDIVLFKIVLCSFVCGIRRFSFFSIFHYFHRRLHMDFDCFCTLDKGIYSRVGPKSLISESHLNVERVLGARVRLCTAVTAGKWNFRKINGHPSSIPIYFILSPSLHALNGTTTRPSLYSSIA